MIYNKTICVTVPCYNVSHLIDRVIETMPDYVDHIVCVDDCSGDDTGERIAKHSRKDSRISLISNTHNQGVGGAIGEGYAWAVGEKIASFRLGSTLCMVSPVPPAIPAGIWVSVGHPLHEHKPS